MYLVLSSIIPYSSRPPYYISSTYHWLHTSCISCYPPFPSFLPIIINIPLFPRSSVPSEHLCNKEINLDADADYAEADDAEADDAEAIDADDADEAPADDDGVRWQIAKSQLASHPKAS